MAKREQENGNRSAFDPEDPAARLVDQPDEEDTGVESGARYQGPQKVAVDGDAETGEGASQDNIVSITPESLKPEIAAELKSREKDFEELFKLLKKYKSRDIPPLWKLKANNPKVLGPLLESIEQTLEPGLKSVGESKADHLLEAVIGLAHKSDSPYNFVKRLYDTSSDPNSKQAKFYKALVKGIEEQVSEVAEPQAA